MVCAPRSTQSYTSIDLEVQMALHVIPAVAPSKWDTCSDLVDSNWQDSPRTVLDIYHDLMHFGLRMGVQIRLSQLPPLGRYSIDALKLPTVRPWHAWYDDGQDRKQCWTAVMLLNHPFVATIDNQLDQDHEETITLKDCKESSPRNRFSFPDWVENS
ncbi:hypothetical protein Ddye_006550, partial [Dipteronia dyeriana]